MRQIVGSTGVTSLIAGSAGNNTFADGTGMAARFETPGSVMNDHSGYLWVPDGTCFRRIQISTGAVTTPIGVHGSMVASTDGTGTAATFNFAGSGAVDDSGNLFVSDYSAVRKIESSTLKVTTIAGSTAQDGSADGARGQARFLGAQGLAPTAKATSTSPTSTTIRSGASRSPPAKRPRSPAWSAPRAATPTGQRCQRSSTIPWRRGRRRQGLRRRQRQQRHPRNRYHRRHRQHVRRHGGAEQGQEKDGTGPTAAFSEPYDVVSDGKGNLFVSDYNGCTIRQIVIATQVVTTLAGSNGACTDGDGTGAAARFMYPTNLGVDGLGNVYNADNRNHVIRRINIATGVVKTIAGTAGTTGSADGAGNVALFNGPSGVTGDATGASTSPTRTTRRSAC